MEYTEKNAMFTNLCILELSQDCQRCFLGANWFDQVKKEIQPSPYHSCGYDVTFGNLNIAMENYIFW